MVPPESCTWICRVEVPTTPVEMIRFVFEGSAAPVSSTPSGGAIQ